MMSTFLSRSIWNTLAHQAIVGIVVGVFAVEPLSAQRFYDVADNIGVQAAPNSNYLGSGVSVYDFNQDGWDDLSIPMSIDSCQFYFNDGGQYVAAPQFIAGFGEIKHLLWVDYDNDGDLDIALSSFEGQYKLFNNDGNFNFTDVSVEAGLMQGVERYYGMCFGDYDRDGDLDFYVTCYNPASYAQTFDRLNHLYRNNGDGTFTNVTLEAGVGDGWRLSFQAVWLDYDMDGWPDLFVINDHNYENSLYRNNGDGTFSDVSEEAGIKFGGHNPMTITVGDFDNDGDLDIYTTNTDALVKRAMLLVNNGNGTFTNQSEQYGVDVHAWTWGAVWLDMDNDTDQDLFVATGHISPNVETNENYLFESFEGAFFEDITSSELEGQDNRKSYGVGRGDFNNDGYPDIVVVNRHPFNMNMWQNEGGDQHYVKITLQGTVSNNMAVGSWIRLYVDGQVYTQYTLCGENYIGQNSQHHIFGVNTATEVDSIEVEYVSGHFDKYYSLEVDTHYYFTEGETFVVEITPSGPLSFCEGEEVVLDAGQHNIYSWNTGHDGRYLAVSEPGNYWVAVENQGGWTEHSDTLTVEVYSQPVIQVEVHQPLCNGEANGSMQVENLTGVQLDEVLWNNGQTGDYIEEVEAGTYLYEVVDMNGCNAAGTVFVNEPQPLSVLFFTYPPVAGDDGSISLVINGGTPPYTVLLDGETTLPNMDGLEAGTYDLTVHDSNFCAVYETISLAGPTGVHEHSRGVQLFPNPAKQFLQISNDQTIYSVNILAADGRILKDVPILTNNQIDISQIASGIYYLQAYDHDGNLISGRFVKD